MRLFSPEEFASRRRGAQTRIEEALHPIVEESVDTSTDTSGWDLLLDAVEEQYEIAYAEDGEGTAPPLPQGWKDELRSTLRETTAPRDDRTVNNISIWLATWVLSQASIAAANADPEDIVLEWVDMGDSNVRPAHAKTSGQQRPPGEPFDVDGVEMPYPGWPGAPIELWINCRCTLRPVIADEFRAKAGYFSIPEKVEFDGGNGDETFISALMHEMTRDLGQTDPETLTAGGDMPEDEITEVAPEEVNTPIEDISVNWYGVITVEDTRSGDGRKFAANSMLTRPLPLPLTWQRTSADGHDGSVTVAKIERLTRVGKEIRGAGSFIVNAEADEVVGLLGEFGRYGVSVDADDVEFELDEEAEEIVFTKSRACSASIVSIPAFAEAYVSLGDAPDDFFDGGEDLATEGPDAEDEALVASTSFAPGTQDGPGWLTHPVDTDRLRDYWTKGPGAAKIAWGTPGDFNRCRLLLAEYVKPQHLAGYCANRHKDALGFWPGEHHSLEAPADDEMAPAVSVVASAAAAIEAPHEWFTDPQFTEKTHFTVTKEGEVFGHIATWDTCHGKFTDQCVLPPRSMTNYAHFATGQVLTDKGLVNTGPITVALDEKQRAHAPDRLRMRPAVAHYENTCAAVADVAVGEDQFGIWAHGWVRPGATPEQIAALRASDVSGDWRLSPTTNSMEMIAALAVNSGGFHTPRVAAAIENGQQISLVAAGYLPADKEQEATPAGMEKFGQIVAEFVAKELAARTERKKQMAALAAQIEED